MILEHTKYVVTQELYMTECIVILTAGNYYQWGAKLMGIETG